MWGATQLSGFEFDLHTVNIEGKFRWSTDFNISSYKDRWKERNPDVVLDPWVGKHDPIRAVYGFLQMVSYRKVRMCLIWKETSG